MRERKWMTEMRERKCLSIKSMARLCKCTAFLLESIEQDGWVTHPHIASRIAHYYGFTLEQYNNIVPECRRSETLPEPVEPPDDHGLTLDEVIMGRYRKGFTK